MAPQKKKFDINPSASTTQHKENLSPGSDDSSSMLKLSTRFTPEKITPQKK